MGSERGCARALVALSSKPAAPRDARGCPLDLEHPRASSVRTARRARFAGQNDDIVVHLLPRSSCEPTPGGVLDRTRRWSGRGAQQAATSLASHRVVSGSPARVVADRHSPHRSETYVRRAPGRGALARGQRAMTWTSRPQRLFLAMIEAYQRATDGRPSPCRFTPTCSAYALEAVQRHGARAGAWLIVRRLSHCRPFGPYGFDPVPDPANPALPGTVDA